LYVIELNRGTRTSACCKRYVDGLGRVGMHSPS
jgi:hypothetical protein